MIQYHKKEKELKNPLSTEKEDSSFEKFFIRDQKLNESSIDIIDKNWNKFDLNLNEEANMFFSQELSILVNKKELYNFSKKDEFRSKDVNIVAQIKGGVIFIHFIIYI